jgi:hypothetical protein
MNELIAVSMDKSGWEAFKFLLTMLGVVGFGLWTGIREDSR